MNIFDIAIVLIIIMFGLVGFKKGIIKQGVSLVGIILVFAIAFLLKGYIGSFLCKYLPFFSFGRELKGIVVLNILMYQLIGFLAIFFILFGVYFIIVKMSSAIQKLVNMTIVFAIPSKIAGFILGLIEGYILVFVVLLVLLIPMKKSNLYLSSNVINGMLYNTPVLSTVSNDTLKSIDEIYDLGNKIKNKKISKNDANLKSLDVMLKYKIVNKKTVEQLIVLDKLKSVKHTNRVLKKY